jgi:hypothetical protein
MNSTLIVFRPEFSRCEASSDNRLRYLKVVLWKQQMITTHACLRDDILLQSQSPNSVPAFELLVVCSSEMLDADALGSSNDARW